MKIVPLFLCFCLFLAVFSCAPSESRMKESKIHYEMGLLYFQEGDSIRALQELVKSKDINPDDKHTWNVLGLTYKERKLYREAEDAFNSAIKLDDRFSEAYNNLGVLYLDRKNYKEAIKCFESAAKNIFYTTPELVYNNMGYAYHKMSDFEAAEKNYKEAIALNPSFESAYMNMAQLYMERKRNTDAERVLRKFLSVFENNIEANFLLGKLYFGNGERQKATPYFVKVIKLDSRSSFAAMAKDYLDAGK
jgi:type IV pilus biogenesis/stability protein PilW